MELFFDEIINITGIASVYRNDTEESEVQKNPVIRYGTNPSYCQLIFFLKGDCTTVFNGVTINDCENSLRFLPAASIGEYVVTRRSADSCIDIVFTCNEGVPKVALGYRGMSNLKDKFVKIYNLWSYKKPGYYAKCMTVLYEIIDEIKSTGAEYISKTQRDALDAAHKYILEHYTSDKFDYKALSKASGYSYSHFKELFLKHYKLSPVKYVTQMRIAHACDLLLAGIYSVTEVSAMCGFENVYYFSKVFKEAVGVTPGRYGKT